MINAANDDRATETRVSSIKKLRVQKAPRFGRFDVSERHTRRVCRRVPRAARRQRDQTATRRAHKTHHALDKPRAAQKISRRLDDEARRYSPMSRCSTTRQRSA